MSTRPAAKPAAGEDAANRSASEHPLFDADEIAKLTNRNFEVMTRAARACFNCATAVNQEMADFLGNRLRQDFEAAKSIMSSRNSDDAFAAQADFAENALRDYAENTSKMFDIAAKITRDALKPAPKEKSDIH